MQKDYEEFASTLMNIVDRVVDKTNVPLSLSLQHYHTNIVR